MQSLPDKSDNKDEHPVLCTLSPEHLKELLDAWADVDTAKDTREAFIAKRAELGQIYNYDPEHVTINAMGEVRAAPKTA